MGKVKMLQPWSDQKVGGMAIQNAAFHTSNYHTGWAIPRSEQVKNPQI
jgi:hypothetical protein